jgi:hypothetical protein
VAITRRNRHKRACKRLVTAATVSVAGVQGANSITISAHEGGHTLKPGSYRVTVVAVDASGHATTALTTTLTIVK